MVVPSPEQRLTKTIEYRLWLGAKTALEELKYLTFKQLSISNALVAYIAKDFLSLDLVSIKSALFFTPLFQL